MLKTFRIGWVRFSKKYNHKLNSQWIQQYCNKPVPFPCLLEGNGIQYIFAIDDTEVTEFVLKMKLDEHEINMFDITNKIIDDPCNYQVMIDYRNKPYYFLKLVSDCEYPNQ